MRVKDESTFPVRVLIRTSPKAEGVAIEISLPFPAAWKGRVLPLVQVVVTDSKGQASIYLPPTSEMTWLVPNAAGEPTFKVSIPGYGSFPVSIPTGVDEYVIGG